MATIKSFEDLEVWQKARVLANDVWNQTLTNSFSKDFSLRDQINRSSGSVMDNIAEGFERGGNKEFIQFLSYSKGSCGEVRSQLYRAKDRNHITEGEFNTLTKQATEVGKQIGGFMNYLSLSEIKGSKFINRKQNK
ncbi:MAG: four helix bundle protein [Cyclobacteriaceae bacterium]|nr:four helix bundle protein [Cyclobacteriaceae bacterium]